MSTDQLIHQKEEEFSGRLDMAVWRRLWTYARRYGRCLWGLISLAAVVAGVEAGFPLITKYAIDDAAANGPQANLPLYIFCFAALMATMCCSVWTFIRLSGWLSAAVSHDIRKDGFEHLQQLSFSYFDRRPAGWLMARLTSDCDNLSRLISWGTLDVVWGSCMMVGCTVIMLAIHWQLGALLLGILPVVTWISLFFQKRILSTARAVRKRNSTITAGFNECIAGVRTTKTLAREQRSLAEFGELTDGMYADSVRNAILRSAYFPLVMGMSAVGAAVVLWIGGAAALNKTLSLGTLILFFSYAGSVIWPIMEISRVFADMQNTQAAAERVFGLIATEPDVKDTPKAVEAMRAAAEISPEERAAMGLAIDGYPDRIDRIEFLGVGFHYKQGLPVLTDFNLTVHAGQTIALVGPTGGGKTTVVSLLCRFYEPITGEIRIDGVEYRDRSLAWLQSHLGIVLQEPHLFSGTIAENIRYGRPDATDAEVERAARLVRAHDFIMKQEKGYQFEVGERGTNLSTGQKQLVSFARAVLADPRIFVMDEATSSVDTETEKLIQDGLHAVLTGRISFIIAHRLSTIRSADHILVIDAGRIVEQGTHRELIAQGARYFELYTTQFAEERTAALLDHPAAE